MMKKIFMKLSTFWQMSIIAFSVMILIFLFTYVAQFLIVKAWIFHHEEESLEFIYDQIEIFFDYENLDYGRYIQTFDLMDVDLVVYDENKDIIFLTDDVPEIIKTQSLPIKISMNFEKVDGDEKIILNGPINLQGKQFYIYIEKEIELYEDFLEKMIPIMFIALIFITGMSLFAGMYISKKFINKLKVLKLTMENVKEKGVDNRVKILNEKDEFEKIGIVFNSMMDEVEKSFNLQKQFVQDASHELRTPLTILKGHLQMLNRWGKNDKDTLDKSLKIALDEIERLIKLVNDLLSLTKMENQFKESVIDEKININDVIEEVIYGFDMLKEDIEFNFEKSNDVYFKILKEHLKQLIIIFIDNAIKYCDKDKKIIRIKVFEDDFNVFISIKDNGIGIKKEEIGKITDKFYRVDKSRKYNNSFGIGLSIASQLVKLYKGKLEIKSEFGVSTEVVVSFEK